jgi:cytochrome c oxidase cbb3-type subunit IV
MHLDLNIVRSFVTVALFVLFIALCVWAWSDRRRDEFAAAARLPFDESDSVTPAHAAAHEQAHEEKH